MGFLYWLESIRNPMLDAVMSVITYLGDEVAFLVFALTVFWCVDKRRGYYLMTVGYFGVIINQTLKLLFRIPRPWVTDEKFTIVESAREAAAGYSFPSGHTQNAAGTLGGIARFTKTGWIQIASVVTIVLVSFSRMYLGVHTPLDVAVSLLVGAALVFSLYPLFVYAEKKPNVMFPLLGCFFVLSVAYLVFTYCFPFPADIDAVNLLAGRKTAFTLLGATGGILVVYPMERYLVKFDEKATIWGQIVKVVLGLLAVLAVKQGLSFLFGGDAEPFALRAVRYFIVVIVAGAVYPMSFRFLSKIGRKAEVSE